MLDLTNSHEDAADAEECESITEACHSRPWVEQRWTEQSDHIPPKVLRYLMRVDATFKGLEAVSELLLADASCKQYSNTCHTNYEPIFDSSNLACAAYVLLDRMEELLQEMREDGDGRLWKGG